MQHSAEFLDLCDQARSRVRELSIDQAAAELAAACPPLLIDVREADEFATGHLPNAQHLSKGWIEAKIHTLVKDKNAPVILYCGGGNRSLLAADSLQKMGYKNLRSMTGGYSTWKQSGKHTV